MIIIVVVVVIVVALAAVGFYFVYLATRQASQTVQATVTDATWDLVYTGSSSGYFGSTPLSSCNGCPHTGFVGSSFTITLHLTSTDSVSSHSVTSVTVDPPFTLFSVTPTLPTSVSPGGSTTLALTIQYPFSSGSYSLTGTIYTS